MGNAVYVCSLITVRICLVFPKTRKKKFQQISLYRDSEEVKAPFLSHRTRPWRSGFFRGIFPLFAVSPPSKKRPAFSFSPDSLFLNESAKYGGAPLSRHSRSRTPPFLVHFTTRLASIPRPIPVDRYLLDFLLSNSDSISLSVFFSPMLSLPFGLIFRFPLALAVGGNQKHFKRVRNLYACFRSTRIEAPALFF